MFVGTLIDLLKKPNQLVSGRFPKSFTNVGLKPGDLLRNRYRVIQVLSRGGWGETYIARDLDRPGIPRCVIKILKPSTDDQASLDMAEGLFTREAETLEWLGQHKQIPMLLAYFQTNGNFYLVQEFIDGFPLDTEFAEGLQWTETKVISLLIEVLEILTFVHSQQVIHRDIKPSNLIRRRYDGRLVLIDFGAVKQIRESAELTQTQIDPLTVSIGTRGYMPLEQFAGRPRLSSDVYALGIICIQALTGIDAENLPRNSDDEVIWKAHTQVTGPIIEILDKMVRSRYGERYQSSEAVLSDLTSNFPDKVAAYRNASKLDKQPPREDPFRQEDNLIVKKYSRRTPIPLSVLGVGTLLILSSLLIVNSNRIHTFLAYRALASSLKAKDWEAADRDNFDLLLRLVGKDSQERGLFTTKEWKLFLASEENCRHVENIDSLWRSASSGRLGLIAQKRIFEEEISRGSNVSRNFYTRIKWIGKNAENTLVEWNYDKASKSVIYAEGKQPNFENPTEGHLPIIMAWEESEGQKTADKRFELLQACRL